MYISFHRINIMYLLNPFFVFPPSYNCSSISISRLSSKNTQHPFKTVNNIQIINKSSVCTFKNLTSVTAECLAIYSSE